MCFVGIDTIKLGPDHRCNSLASHMSRKEYSRYNFCRENVTRLRLLSVPLLLILLFHLKGILNYRHVVPMTYDAFPSQETYEFLETSQAANILYQPESSHIQLVILIFSARMNYDQRDAVRRCIVATTRLVQNNIAIKFVVGNHPSKASLPPEPDLLELDLLDSYSSLPAKLKLGYRWALREYPSVQWVAKVDDDSIIWPNRLSQFLGSLSSSKLTVVGKIFADEVVLDHGKWKEDNYKKNPIYPLFPKGSFGHVASRGVLEFLETKTVEELFEYQGEDTSLGIWLEDANVAFIDVPTLMRNDQDCSGSPMVVGHNMKSLNSMKQCLIGNTKGP